MPTFRSPPRTNGACGYGLHGLWAGAANVDRLQGVFRLRWHPSRSATPRFGVREPDRLTPFGVRCLSPRGMGSNRSSQIDTAGRFRRVPPRMPTYRCSRLGKGGAGQCPPWSLGEVIWTERPQGEPRRRHNGWAETGHGAAGRLPVPPSEEVLHFYRRVISID